MAKTTNGDLFYQEFEPIIGKNFTSFFLEAMIGFVIVELNANISIEKVDALELYLAKYVNKIFSKSNLETIVEYLEENVLK